SRFGPHAFTKDEIHETFNGLTEVHGFIGVDVESGQIIAYALIRDGCLEQDSQRYAAYGIRTEERKVCTFAPSVSDNWQSSGLGSMLFDFVMLEISQYGYSAMILWGGVQASNVRAVNFYTRKGFVAVGGFERNGNNIDMICYL
ncbi:MAG: GNAT family N-acetyltransferase, partial [Lentimicrobium sp.]|nr:GNAT family N-acetyltransferase [Lentimicrobium sp.]